MAHTPPHTLSGPDHEATRDQNPHHVHYTSQPDKTPDHTAGSAPSPAVLAHAMRTPTRKTIRRGDIWFVTKDTDRPSTGTEMWPNRPAIIVSNDALNRTSGFAQIIYLTKARKKPSPTHVALGHIIDQKIESVALCEQIHTVDISRLDRYLGHVNAENMIRINKGLSFSMNLNNSP